MKKYDGWVVIGSDLDTKKFDQKIKQTERNIEKFEQEASKKQIEIDVQTEKVKEAEENLKRLKDEYDKFIGDSKGYGEGTDFDIPGISADQVEQIISDTLAKMDVNIDKANEKLEQQKAILDKQRNSYNDIIYKIEEEKAKIEETETALGKVETKARHGQLIKAINGINKGLDNAIKKVGRWTLAIFGAVSAFAFVRRSMSVLSSYNEQLATDLEYIRFAIASTLLPVVEKLIQLIYRILQYVAYLLKALFGINIFANAGVDAFNKTNKALGSAAKNAKELKNQLASFDEMNVLQDTSGSASSGGSGSDLKIPSVDLSKLEGKRPWWLDWIIENKDILLAFIAGLTAGLIALRVIGLEPIQALGIGIAIAGIILLIQDIIKFIKDPSWDNFVNIVRDIALVVLGVALAFEAWPVAVAAAAVLIVALIIKYWDEIKAFFQKGIDWLVSKAEGIRNKFGNTIGSIYEYFVSGLQLMLTGFDTFFKGLKQIFNGIITFIKGVFAGDWKKAWEGIKEIFRGVFTSLSGIVQTILGTIRTTIGTFVATIGTAVWNAFKSIINSILGFVEGQLNKPIAAINSLIGTINKLPGVNIGKLSGIYLPRLAKGGIINMPGRGVPIGGAIGGERGQEGVIPLTDSQQMQLLGEAIGKYITVNANIVNTMNGRVISRELQKINNESDFAFNR